MDLFGVCQKPERQETPANCSFLISTLRHLEQLAIPCLRKAGVGPQEPQVALSIQSCLSPSIVGLDSTGNCLHFL